MLSSVHVIHADFTFSSPCSLVMIWQVRVLFTHPSYNRMKPCSFFMEGKCKFSEETCKFSHGHVVSFSELQPFQDPDFRLVL